MNVETKHSEADFTLSTAYTATQKKIKGLVLKTRVVVPYGFGAAESESGVSLPELALVWLLIVKKTYFCGFSRRFLEAVLKMK